MRHCALSWIRVQQAWRRTHRQRRTRRRRPTSMGPCMSSLLTFFMDPCAAGMGEDLAAAVDSSETADLDGAMSSLLLSSSSSSAAVRRVSPMGPFVLSRPGSLKSQDRP